MATARAEWRLIAAALYFILLQFSLPVSAKWVKSSIDTNQDWTFVTRFCFLSKDGKFDYVFKYPKSYGIQQLLLYYDEPGQWESVYKTSKNCTERLSVLSKANNQIIDLTNEITGSRPAGCKVFTQNGEEYYNCTDQVSFRASRERWWYIAIARCETSQGGSSGLKLDYQMHLMNGPPDDFLHHELSADEFYILPVDIAFLLAYFIMLILSIVCAVHLFNKQMFHTTYKMYITAVCLWFFGLFLQCIAWGRYSETGWEESPTEVTGRLCYAASTAVFILMLLLMAKGYTITRGRLTQMSTVRLTIFFCLYVIVNVTLFIWEGMFFDEGFVLYFYESPPGYGLIAMRLIGWMWFLYAFAFTMKHHPHKAKFYIPFFIFYTAWFWAGPVVIMIAIFSVAKWSREKTVNGVEQFVALLGHGFFLILTRPQAANSNFPFHLRTCQVRFSDNEDEPTDTYAMSEESRQHLENIFVVQRNDSQNPSSRPPSYATANRGYENGGYTGDGGVSNGYMKSENGYNPSLEETFTTQRNGHLPPLSTATPSTTLPPIGNGNALPPLRGNPVSPPSYEDQVSPPYQNGPQLPPLPEGPAPLQRNGALPPISPPTAPSLDED